MVFSSVTFLFLFLPVVLAAFWLTPARWRTSLLVVASWIFYAWGEKALVALLAVSALFNWAIAIEIAEANGRARRVLLSAAIAVNLGALVYFKYTDFLLAQLNAVLVWGDVRRVIWQPVCRCSISGRSCARRAGRSYYKGDTHWNARGAFTAASAIADRLRRDLPSVGVIRESEYVVEEAVRDVGDLTNMMGLGLPANDSLFVFRRRSDGAREIKSDALHRVFEQPGSGLPKAVLLGDSFGEALAPLLADAFSRLHYYRSSTGGPNPALIVEEAPDVVILISAERYLPHLGGR